jgi:hypothetical protein
MPQAVPDHVSARIEPLPDTASRLLAMRRELAANALRAAIARDPGLGTRYDATMLRTFTRDYERHLAQLADSLRAGDPQPLAGYLDTAVPLFRRRRVPLEDLATLLLGMRDAVAAVLPPDEGAIAASCVDAGLGALRRPRHLAGNRPGNPIVRFIWKGAGYIERDGRGDGR